MENIIYKYKKDNPDYKINRSKRLIELTKNRYQNDIEFREKVKQRSNDYYHNLKELALKNTIN